MKRWLLGLLMISTAAVAEVGQVTKVIGNDAYLMRGSNKIQLAQDLNLEQGDEVHSNSSYIVLYLYPGSQMSMARDSVLRITENVIEEGKDLERVTSLIDLIKGIIRVQVTKEDLQDIEQKVQTSVAAFAVRGTEFEVALSSHEEVDLDVFEGTVEASSPLVQSFVPEYVKANEGLKLSRKDKKFTRRKFAPRFKDHPGFNERKEIRQKWKELKAKKKSKKAVKKAKRKTTRVKKKNK